MASSERWWLFKMPLSTAFLLLLLISSKLTLIASVETKTNKSPSTTTGNTNNNKASTGETVITEAVSQTNLTPGNVPTQQYNATHPTIATKSPTISTEGSKMTVDKSKNKDKSAADVYVTTSTVVKTTPTSSPPTMTNTAKMMTTTTAKITTKTATEVAIPTILDIAENPSVGTNDKNVNSPLDKTLDDPMGDDDDGTGPDDDDAGDGGEPVPQNDANGGKVNADNNVGIRHHTMGYAEPDGDTHFFVYYLSVIGVCILMYILFHNKQKILALIVEGRQERRRRPNTNQYRPLDNNLEEVIQGGIPKNGRSTNIIY